MYQRKSHITKQSWKLRDKPLHLPSNMTKINNKSAKLEQTASSSRSFISTEVQLLLLHDPVGHKWSWRSLRGSPPDWEQNSPPQQQFDVCSDLTKQAKWRSSQVLHVCSHTRTGFTHPQTQGAAAPKQLACDLLGQGMNQNKQAQESQLSLSTFFLFILFSKAKEHLLTEMLEGWGHDDTL